MSKLLLGAISDYVSLPACLKLMTLPNIDILEQWDNADEEIDNEAKGKLESKANDDSDEEDEVDENASSSEDSD